MLKTKKIDRYLAIGLSFFLLTAVLYLPTPNQNTVSASEHSGGFVIEAEKVEGAINIAAILAGNIQLKKGTIHGLTLTKTLNTSEGEIVVKIKSPGPIKVKNMKAKLMGLPTFGGLYLPEKLGWVGMKDVKMRVSKQTASLLTLPKASVTTAYGEESTTGAKPLKKEDLQALTKKMRKIEKGEKLKDHQDKQKNKQDSKEDRKDEKGTKDKEGQDTENKSQDNGHQNDGVSSDDDSSGKASSGNETSDESKKDGDDHSNADEMSQLRQILRQLDNRVQDTLSEISHHKKQLNDVSNKVTKVLDEIEDVMDSGFLHLGSLQSRLKSALNQLIPLEKDLVDVGHKISNKNEQLNAEQSRLNNGADKVLQEKVSSIKKQIEHGKQQIKLLNKQIEKIRGQIQSTMNDVNKKQGLLGSLLDGISESLLQPALELLNDIRKTTA
ncbi:hypothetical protein [Tuberibacillus sp. Marseille-P3662]|uniref:hypothetical protein n=1 Tax=Tuberibacillus sp. Marseille-P3662 TaxID=1965358 RepID=UPI000A1CA485|nr:hypothetical protein [Tuberibacillus sp. Marseille-P3662]